MSPIEKREKEKIILDSLCEISKSANGVDSLKKINKYINNLISNNTIESKENITKNTIEFDNKDFLIDIDNNWRNIFLNIIDDKNTVINKVNCKINPLGDIIEITNNGQKIQYFTVNAAMREIVNKVNGNWRLPTFEEWQNNKDALIENIRYNGFIGLGGCRLFDSELSNISNPAAHFWTSDIASRNNEYLSITISKNNGIDKDRYGRLQGLYLSVRLVKNKI